MRRRRVGYFIFILIGLLFSKQVYHDRANAKEQTILEAEDDVQMVSVAPTETVDDQAVVQMVQVGEEDIQLYKEETQQSEVIADINYGELLELKQTSEEWYEVVTNAGDTGFVSKNESQLIEIPEQIIPVRLSEATIVLDPGHGGEDTGAISNYQTVYEKDVTFSTAETIATYLEEAGCTVILTRESDTYVGLDEICETSNSNQADIFISLHYDSSENMNEASGTTTYYYYEKYEKLAEQINDSLAVSLPLENRGIEYGNYQVLRENTQPALLLELGYMNSDSGLSIFNTEAYQINVANALLEGLTNYFQN